MTTHLGIGFDARKVSAYLKAISRPDAEQWDDDLGTARNATGLLVWIKWQGMLIENPLGQFNGGRQEFIQEQARMGLETEARNATEHAERLTSFLAIGSPRGPLACHFGIQPNAYAKAIAALAEIEQVLQTVADWPPHLRGLRERRDAVRRTAAFLGDLSSYNGE